ncbi:MAG: hypothetical protein R2824_02405 [Saprospiraceae bacterium]|nr:hypothetical protein [Lewinella sp.]
MAFTCPYCYEKFSRDEFEFRCESFTSTACQEEDPKLARYFGVPHYLANRVIPNKSWRDVMTKKSLWKAFGKMSRMLVVPDEVKCDRCGGPSRKKICPRCHNELPTYFHKAESHIISVIGARGSGKTHYITVLIHELLKRGYKLDISTIPQDVGEDRSKVTSKRYSEEYKRPLLDRGEELTKTTIAKDLNPLIYQITSSQKGFGKTKALYLVFYDTAGENFHDDQELKKLANYVANSSGIIFLLDTFQIPHIKNSLRSAGNAITESGIDFQGVFQQVYNLLEKQGLVKLKARSPVPIALTFSKIDEVIRNNLLDDDIEDFSIRKNSKYLEEGFYDQAELEEVSHDMRSLLTLWEEEGFIAGVESKFSQTAYFGVSALGATPKGGKIEDVRPLRVLDPLVWILDKIGFALPKK